jgi:hypothetical protein
MGSRRIALWTIAALALGGGCTSSTSTDAAYVPTYAGSTIAYDPLYDSAVDPWAYSDPYWGYLRPPETALVTLPAQFNDLAAVSAVVVSLNKALAPFFGAMKNLALESEVNAPSDAGTLVREFPGENLPSSTQFATFRLRVVTLTSSTRGFFLEAKPVGGSDSQYKGVAAGTFGNLVADNKGAGVMVVGFTELNSVNPTAFPAMGRAIIAAAQGQNNEKAVVTRLTAFSPDGVVPPQSGILAGDLTADGVTHVRVATNQDILDGPGVETIADRIAWKPKSGGGGYAIITNGDVASGTCLLARSCWANKNSLVFRDWRSCATTRAPSDCIGDATTVVRTDVGDTSKCTGPLPQVPASAAEDNGPTETAPVMPPALPTNLPLQLPTM